MFKSEKMFVLWEYEVGNSYLINSHSTCGEK